MKIYNGKNCHNNEVVVDFSKQKVEFKPTNAHWTMIKYYRYMSVQYGMAVGILLMMIFAVCDARTFDSPSMLVFLMYDLPFLCFATVFYIFIGIITGFIMNLPFFNKSWVDKYYPYYNAGMISICHILSGYYLHLFPKKVKPQHMKGNVFIIPKFANVNLDYELVGDFADQIEKIEIKTLPLKKNSNMYNFYAVFSFKGLIKDGYMKLWYI